MTNMLTKTPGPTAEPDGSSLLKDASDTRPILISYEQLLQLGIQYSKEHIRRLEYCGLFPERVRLSPKRVAWVLTEIENWILCQSNKRRRTT
jgi:prophage regulatory protein